MHSEELAFLDRAVRKGIYRRIYRAADEDQARSFANLFGGYVYEYFPGEWYVNI